MRKKALTLSVFAATAMVSTPAFAQVDAPVSETPDPAITDIGTGDAEVQLITTVTGAVLPGQDAWVSFMWVGDHDLQARNFEVTAIGSDGVEVGYPDDHEGNTRAFSSLHESSVLDAGLYDFTALKLVVSPNAVDPQLELTVSYDSDTGPVTQTFLSTIAIDTSVYQDEALELADGPLGLLDQGETAWFPLEVKALHNASEIEFRVVDAGGFDIGYPNEVDYSSLVNGSRIVVGGEDYAAIRFDSLDLEPGVHTVTIEVTYFVGLTPVTQTVERAIEVVGRDDGDGGADDGDDNGPDDGGTDDGGTDDGGTDDGGTDDGGTDDGGTDDGGTDDGGTDDGGTDDGGTDDGDDESGNSGPGADGPVIVGSLSQGIEGWTVNPYGTDTAVTGVWGFGQPPVGIWNNLLLEMGSTPSGNKGWFTLSGTGTEMGDHDLDDGESSVLSPLYSLPDVDDIRLDFDYYLSYLTNATPDDSLRVVMITRGGNKVILHEQAKANTNKEATWTSMSVDLSRYAGQDVQFLITAGDRGTPSYVEAAIDGFTITAED